MVKKYFVAINWDNGEKVRKINAKNGETAYDYYKSGKYKYWQGWRIYGFEDKHDRDFIANRIAGGHNYVIKGGTV